MRTRCGWPPTTELIRRLNRTSVESLDHRAQRLLVHDAILPNLRSPNPARGIRLLSSEREWIESETRRRADGLRASGARVYGDFDDLATPPDMWQDDPPEVTDADLLEEAPSLLVTSHPDTSDPSRLDFVQSNGCSGHQRSTTGAPEPPPTCESGLVSEVVRAAQVQDLSILREIERASGQRFRDFGLDHVADEEPASIEVLAEYASGGRAFVAADGDGAPVGYILVDAVDGSAHIEQVSVAPDHQDRGLGRALIERAVQWAAGHDMNAVTLTTFGHIPWNRPLYEHLGFRVLADDELSPGLRAIRAVEAEHGLDPALRVVMRRDVHPEPRADGL